MSNRAITWAYEQPVKHCGAKFVLVALADHADEQGYCYPSQETLAAMTSQKDRTVRAHLAQLESDGFIRRVPRYGGRGRTSDGYYLLAPPEKLKQKPPKYRQDLPVLDGGNTGKKLQVYRQDLPLAESAREPSVRDRILDPPKNPQSLSLDLESQPARARADETPAAAPRECECRTPHESEFCDDERKRAARNLPHVNSPEAYAMTKEARSGVHDAMYAAKFAELGGKSKPAAQPPARCDHTCSRCFGTGYETIPGKGARPCPNKGAAADERAHAPPSAGKGVMGMK